MVVIRELVIFMSRKHQTYIALKLHLVPVPVRDALALKQSLVAPISREADFHLSNNGGGVTVEPFCSRGEVEVVVGALEEEDNFPGPKEPAHPEILVQPGAVGVVPAQLPLSPPPPGRKHNILLLCLRSPVIVAISPATTVGPVTIPAGGQTDLQEDRSRSSRRRR